MKAAKYTGKRAKEFAQAKTINKRTKAGKAEFNEIVLRLNKEESKYQKFSEARRNKKQREREFLQEQERLLLEAINEQKRQAEREALEKETKQGFIRRIEITKETDMTADNPIWESISQRLFAENRVRLLLIVNGQVMKEDIITVEYKSSWENIYWRYIFPFLYSYSIEGFWSDLYLKDADQVAFILTANEQVKSERLAQRYADSGYCAIDPLVELWRRMGENAYMESSKKRCFQIMRKIEKLKERFPNGVPEENMEEVAQIAQRKIIIRDMFGKSYQEFNSRSTKSFVWTNSREHHLDVGSLFLEGVAEKIDAEKFEAIHSEHLNLWKDKKQRYLMEGGSDGVTCIRSASGAWRLRDPLFDAFENVHSKLKLREYSIDCIKYPLVNDYIREACVVNSAPVRLSMEKATGHHDLAAAYTQHSMTSYFQGFMGKIHQWRRVNVRVGVREFLAKHLGIFRCKIIDCQNNLFKKLGLEDVVTLPSPEWLYFLDRGVQLEIVSGVFGSKWTATKDELYEGLMNPIGDVKKPYAHFAGCFGHQNEKKTYRFHGSNEWAAHLKYLGYETYYCDGIITVKIDKEFSYSFHHILAFITSYTRINMLEAMEKFKEEDLVAVVLDGIYYKGECPDIGDQFKEKKVKEVADWSCAWYRPSYADDSFMPVMDEKLLGNCILSGQGGCGKTWSILTDKGFNDILYVVPQHTLGIDNAKQHSVRYTTIHKLVGIESKDNDGKIVRCRPWKEERAMPSVCLIDEMTMIPADWIKRAIELYPHTRFYIAGDVIRHNGEIIAMQTRSGKPGMFNNIFDGDLPIKYFLEDRRSQDSLLKEMKLEIRQQMIRLYTDGEVADAMALASWVSMRYNTVKLEDVKFAEGDTFIAGTHKTNDKLLAMGIVSGYLSKKNERSKEFTEGWTKRGSFTTHSYQGSTICNGKVFVCINDSFELAMIYTAISRAVRSDQIVLVA